MKTEREKAGAPLGRPSNNLRARAEYEKHPVRPFFFHLGNVKVWRELKINLRRSETTTLVSWFDRDATRAIHPSDLCNAVFADNNNDNKSRKSSSARYSFRPKDQPLPPPPKPAQHVIQAQRSAALALGNNSRDIAGAAGHQPCPPLPRAEQEQNILQPPGPGGKGGGCGERPKGAPYFENKIAWNWQGPTQNQDGNEREEDASGKPVGDPHGQLLGAVGSPCFVGNSGVALKRGGISQASGETIVAEKIRIERRLTELKQERRKLLREKKNT